MGFKRAILSCFLLFGLTRAIEVNIASDWIPNAGWQLVCDWSIPPDDKLQSVRLYQNSQQFMIYRPETHGAVKSVNYNNSDNHMKVNCQQAVAMGIRGKCTLTMELLKPPLDSYLYTCEVSGERPWFKIERKDYILQPFVTPNNAVLSISEQKSEKAVHVMLNCTSSGIPTPNIVWTVGDQKVPPNFSGNHWNSTTKLFHVWSFLSFTPQSDGETVTCTPTATNPTGQTENGQSAEYKYCKNGISTFNGIIKKWCQ